VSTDRSGEALTRLMRAAQYFFPGEQSPDRRSPYREGGRAAEEFIPLWYPWRPCVLYRRRVAAHPAEPGTSGRRRRRIGVRC
jgi:hypothetical protein